MSAPIGSRIGGQIYASLPEVYRTRDKGDLARYLDACGELLDRVYATLRQRLDDNFPDTCQEWLIPYFADLVDVMPRSPEALGQRREIAGGIAWRQRKGTAACTEDIAQAVGDAEVELQEGWQRVARTARPGEKPLPAALFGEAGDPDRRDPLSATQHPDLPVVTVDLRRSSRALRVDKRGLFTRATHYPGSAGTLLWEQANPHGAPCFPGSYEDRSARTVDLRTPDSRRGQFHPKRLLAFVPVPEGFFPVVPVPAVPLAFDWSNVGEALADKLVESATTTEVRGELTIRRIVYRRHPDRAAEGKSVQINGSMPLNDAVPAGEDLVYRFEDLNIDGVLSVAQGRLELERCALRNAIVSRNDAEVPVLAATDCLLRDLQALAGLVQLECCTVLGTTLCLALQAIDTLLAGPVRRDLSATPPPPRIVCLSHVRVPPGLPEALADDQRKRVQRYTTEVPVFFSTQFGDAGAGVLHPATAQSIRQGAEDGGELGAYHYLRLSLRWDAMRDKLAEYLPFGMEAVLIPDERLSCAPPSKRATPG
ncbi:MAG TPA: phage tail protein [Burkholderiales bacterium]|nr:phage tail protein [Burkholderiales bacterium]